jgi:hypothetical protein
MACDLCVLVFIALSLLVIQGATQPPPPPPPPQCGTLSPILAFNTPSWWFLQMYSPLTYMWEDQLGFYADIFTGCTPTRGQFDSNQGSWVGFFTYTAAGYLEFVETSMLNGDYSSFRFGYDTVGRLDEETFTYRFYTGDGITRTSFNFATDAQRPTGGYQSFNGSAPGWEQKLEYHYTMTNGSNNLILANQTAVDLVGPFKGQTVSTLTQAYEYSTDGTRLISYTQTYQHRDQSTMIITANFSYDTQGRVGKVVVNRDDALLNSGTITYAKDGRPAGLDLLVAHPEGDLKATISLSYD